MSTKLSRKERGLCHNCSNLPLEGKTRCQECVDKQRERKRGQCSCCKNPPRKGKTLCQSCADKRRDRMRARRAEGYCIKTGCRNKTVGGASRCEKHVQMRSAYNKKVADARRRTGLCPACGKRPPEDGFVHCAPCKKAHRDRVRAGKFGGNRNVVIDRDNHECQICRNKKHMVVHHIDGSGRDGQTGFEENNEIDNLIYLCRKCHADIHRIGNKGTRGVGAQLVMHSGERAEILDPGAYRGKKWRLLRLDVLNRDSGSCQLCGVNKGKIVIHHKDDRGPGRALPANNELDNLVSLCQSCHNAVTSLRNNGSRQLASKLIHALGPGTTGQRQQPAPAAR